MCVFMIFIKQHKSVRCEFNARLGTSLVWIDVPSKVGSFNYLQSML